jgi:hypothetical protein
VQLVTVAAFPDAIAAHLAVARLVAEGIRSSTADEHIISADWFYTGAVGGVKVLVHPEDLDRAREILRERRAPVADPDESGRCPRCGSDAVGLAIFTSRVAFLVLAVLSIPLPWSVEHGCRDCGHRWRVRRGGTIAAPRAAPSAEGSP